MARELLLVATVLAEIAGGQQLPLRSELCISDQLTKTLTQTVRTLTKTIETLRPTRGAECPTVPPSHMIVIGGAIRFDRFAHPLSSPRPNGTDIRPLRRAT